MARYSPGRSSTLSRFRRPCWVPRHEFVRTAWLAEHFGLDPGVAHKDLNDWCPTGTTKLKLPPWWPPIPEPEPHPDWAVDFHLGFAARLSAVAEEREGTRLGESIAKAIDRSVAVIESADT